MPLDCEEQGMLFLEFWKLIGWHPGDGNAPGPEPWPWTTLKSGSTLGVLCQLWPPAPPGAALGCRSFSQLQPGTALLRAMGLGFPAPERPEAEDSALQQVKGSGSAALQVLRDE